MENTTDHVTETTGTYSRIRTRGKSQGKFKVEEVFRNDPITRKFSHSHRDTHRERQ